MTIKKIIIGLLLISTTAFAAAKIQNADIKSNAAIDATKLIDGSVSNAELGYINGLTSDAQTQIGAKLDSSSFTDAAVTSKLLTGYVSGAGVVAATDSILQAIQKLNGNVAAIVPGTGDVVGPASAVNNNVVFFDGVTGKLIKDSGLTLSGSNTGDQTITLTGDVTGSGTGSFATTIGALKVLGSMIANATIDLTTKVTGLLPLSNGGTNKNMTPANGGVVWTDADSMEVISAGTAGQLLQSNGAAAPTWVAAPSTSPLTTKGDVYTYDTANARLPVGTNGQVLSANSAQATGLEWVTPASGGDASTNTATSVDSEVALFSGTGGKTLKRATGTGYAKLASGVLSAQSTPIPSADVNGGRTVNAQTGTTYTFALSDGSGAGGFPLVTASNASAQTYTVPPNSSVAFPVGTQIDLVQQGAGAVTIAPGSGVTVNAANGLTLPSQYSSASLIKTGTDTWSLVQASTSAASSGGVESAAVGGTTANNDCTGANCALFNNTSKITAVSRSTTGRFQVTLSSTGCSAAWVCTAAGWDYTNARPTFCGHDGGTGNASTTAFYFACRESSGSYSDGNVKIQCSCKP